MVVCRDTRVEDVLDRAIIVDHRRDERPDATSADAKPSRASRFVPAASERRNQGAHDAVSVARETQSCVREPEKRQPCTQSTTRDLAPSLLRRQGARSRRRGRSRRVEIDVPTRALPKRMNLSSFHARLAFVAQFRSSPSSSLVRLVQSETRRARLSVRARKPFGGQVLFTARTVPGRVVDAFTTRARRLSAENVAVERVERAVSRRRRRRRCRRRLDVSRARRPSPSRHRTSSTPHPSPSSSFSRIMPILERRFSTGGTARCRRHQCDYAH